MTEYVTPLLTKILPKLKIHQLDLLDAKKLKNLICEIDYYFDTENFEFLEREYERLEKFNKHDLIENLLFCFKNKEKKKEKSKYIIDYFKKEK